MRKCGARAGGVPRGRCCGGAPRAAHPLAPRRPAADPAPAWRAVRGRTRAGHRVSTGFAEIVGRRWDGGQLGEGASWGLDPERNVEERGIGKKAADGGHSLCEGPEVVRPAGGGGGGGGLFVQDLVSGAMDLIK